MASTVSSTSSASTAAPVSPVRPRSAGRLWLTLGLVASVIGFAAYQVQIFAFKKLDLMPWYAPVVATLGVLFIGLSLSARRTWVRYIALGLVVLLAGAQWMFFVSLTKLPAYAGPKAGQKLPPFQSQLAGGALFSNAELAGQSTALVFFRGRW